MTYFEEVLLPKFYAMDCALMDLIEARFRYDLVSSPLCPDLNVLEAGLAEVEKWLDA